MMHKKFLEAIASANNFIQQSKPCTARVQKVLPFLLLGTVISACAPFMGRETMGEYVDDASITTSVKNEIFQDPALKMFQIHVETFQNTVQLSGFVDSQSEAKEAERIARTVKGVHAVKNNLVVRKRR